MKPFGVGSTGRFCYFRQKLDFWCNDVKYYLGCKRPCSRPRRIEAEPRLNIRCISDASDGSVIRSQHTRVCVVIRGRDVQNLISRRYLDFFVPKSGFSGCYVLLRGGFKHKKISGRVQVTIFVRIRKCTQRILKLKIMGRKAFYYT